MQSAYDRYKEMSIELFPTEEIEKLSDEVARDGSVDFPLRASALFLPLDLKIVCTLLDEGYPLGETTDVLNNHSMFAMATRDTLAQEDVRRHADNVMAHVNEVRERKVGEKYDLAKRFYLSRAGSGSLDEAQEGGIVLSMLDGGFAPEVVEKVLLDNSAALRDDSVQSRTLVDNCLEIRRFYHTLKKAVSPSSIHRGSLGAYKYFAGEYMRKNKLTALNVQGDRAIAGQMLAAGLSEDFVSKALRHSPIASEPWRNKMQYIGAVLSQVKELAKRQKYADDRYMLTASMYDDKIGRLLEAVQRKARAYGILASRAYCDGIVARELLEEHQLRSNVERVINKKSPEAKKARGLLTYGTNIVTAALGVLRAEHALLNDSLHPIPEVSTFAELKERGFSIGDLYKEAVHRRIMTYPSTAGMLTAPFLDRDVVEKLMTRYPDIERKELENAIRENSPRAQMSGISKEYPSIVLDNVNERLELLAQQEKRQEEYRKKMEERTQTEKEAFTAGSHTWNLAFCTGLVAIRMLQEGHSAMDILPALVQPPDIMEPDAVRIMSSAENVLSRLDYIRQYNPISDYDKSDTESKVLACDEYIRLYQSAQFDKERLMSDLDAEISKNLILKGYNREDVLETIKEQSPVAAEPGRNPDYSSYVVEQAELAIEKEKERIRLYRPMPRNEHEDDVEKEYEYHLRNTRSAFFLPHEPFMDTLIAEAMRMQGFEALAIGAAIQKLSPCAAGKEGYGFGIVHDLSAPSLEKEQSGPVRVRAIEGT